MAQWGESHSPTLLHLKAQVGRKSHFLSCSVLIQSSVQGRGGSHGWDCSQQQVKSPKQTQKRACVPAAAEWLCLCSGNGFNFNGVKSGSQKHLGREGWRDGVNWLMLDAVPLRWPRPSESLSRPPPFSHWVSACDRASKHPIPQTSEPKLFLSFKLKTLNVFIFLFLDIFFAY